MDDDTLKNVVPHSVATALANNVFPVPGGPTINTPFHGRLMPWKYPGIHNGSTTASSNNLLASVNPAMSSLHDGTNIPVMWQLLLHMYTSVHQHILQHSPVYVRVPLDNVPLQCLH